AKRENQTLLFEARRLRNGPLQEGSREGRKVERLQIAGIFFHVVQAEDKELMPRAEVAELQDGIETRFEGMERSQGRKICWGEGKILLTFLWREARESVQGIEFLCSQNMQSFLGSEGR